MSSSMCERFSDELSVFRSFFYERSDVLELALALLVLGYAYRVCEEDVLELEISDALFDGEKTLVPVFFDGDLECFFERLKYFSRQVDAKYFSSETGLSKGLDGFVLKGGKRDSILFLLRNVFEWLLGWPGLSKEMIGELFEFELKELYDARGLIGSEFYTPRHVVEFMVRAIAPAPGEKIYDPVCGSAGFLVCSDQFVSKNNVGDVEVSLCGREKYEAVARLANWNLFVHGCKGASITVGDSLVEFPGSRFDVVLANPPFSVKDWDFSAFANNGSAIYGLPPKANADYAFLQHIISSLNDGGRAAVIVPSGVLFRGGVEKDIRKRIIEDGLIDAVVSLPSGVFKSTNVSLCVMFLRKVESGKARNNPIFFARPVDRVYSDKSTGSVVCELNLLSRLYKERKDVSGFSRLVDFSEVVENDYDLNCSRYVKSDETKGRRASEIFLEYSSLEKRLRELQDEIKDFAKEVL